MLSAVCLSVINADYRRTVWFSGVLNPGGVNVWTCGRVIRVHVVDELGVLKCLFVFS